MGRLFISGDTHGQIDIHKFTTKEFPIQSELTKDDVVWILGDFGVCWDNGGQDRWIQNWWAEKNFTVISTIGNHEQWDTIYHLPRVRKYGGILRQVKDNVFYAENGIFDIAGKRILNINGADSVDVYDEHGNIRRRQGIDWWSAEQITQTDIERIMRKWVEYDFTADYIFSHTGGSEVCKSLGFNTFPSDKQLDKILRYGFYLTHYCGHYHKDIWATTKSRVVYNDILEVGAHDTVF